MEVGGKNLKFGWSWLFIFVTLGFYLSMRVEDPNWGGAIRALWRAAHVHGNVLAFLNIFYGLLIDRTSLASFLKQTGSWLAIIGALFMGGALFLMPFMPALGILMALGGVAVVLSVAIMVYGQLFTRSV